MKPNNGKLSLSLISHNKNSKTLHFPYQTLKSQEIHHTHKAGPLKLANRQSYVDNLFDTMPERNVVLVTATIGRLVKEHKYLYALQMFLRMLHWNIRPNEFTASTLLHVPIALMDVDLGRQLHASAMKMGLCSIVFVGSALLDFYAKMGFLEEVKTAFEDIKEPNVVSYTTLLHGYLKCGNCERALELFKLIPERNVVTWNAIIGGLSQMGHNEEAVNVLVEMLREGLVVPTQSTFPCAIIAAANIGSLGMGRSFHALVVKYLGYLDAFVGNSLISFYAKCGNMEDSMLVFEKLSERSVVSWNALICGLAQNGKGIDAIKLFERMKESGCRPNGVTLLGVLWACNHAGLVDKGYAYFNQARLEDGIKLNSEHYACMVDLLARRGHFEEAEKFIADLPFDPGIGFWKALLGGCQIHSNMDLGELAARRILALDPGDVSSYVMLSNAHSAAGRWEDVLAIRKEMKEKGMKRVPGCSWIEIKRRIHVFVSGDKSHEHMKDIHLLLKHFTDEMRVLESSEL